MIRAIQSHGCVNTITSPCLVEEIKMDFYRETMPGWMELPDPR